mmetsp:Transcript_23434/g.73712  ORF Transcript_23434/g.73712 Transcript_23434/m.73712 type:complete len:215 (+) Transcript_23434:973-1617(+)
MLMLFMVTLEAPTPVTRPGRPGLVTKQAVSDQLLQPTELPTRTEKKWGEPGLRSHTRQTITPGALCARMFSPTSCSVSTRQSSSRGFSTGEVLMPNLSIAAPPSYGFTNLSSTHEIDVNSLVGAAGSFGASGGILAQHPGSHHSEAPSSLVQRARTQYSSPGVRPMTERRTTPSCVVMRSISSRLVAVRQSRTTSLFLSRIWKSKAVKGMPLLR